MDIPKLRYGGLNKPSSFTSTETNFLFGPLDCDIFESLKILQRIGSDSVFATVWLASLKTENLDVTLAVKMQEDNKKSEKETEINRYFTMNWPDNFLIMYNSIYCEDIRVENKKIKATFMFMEVATADLGQMIRNQRLTPIELIQYILNVCDSVEIMASNFLSHGDLHVGNIFIVQRNGILKAVVGDFGESSYTLSPTTHLSDISNFIGSLVGVLRNSNLGTNFPKKEFENIVKLINRQIGNTSREYDEFVEENLGFNSPEYSPEYSPRHSGSPMGSPEESPDISPDLAEPKIKELIVRDMQRIRELFLDVINK